MKVKVFGTNATVFVHFLGRDSFPIDNNQKVQSTEHTQYSQQVISKGTRFMEHTAIALHGNKIWYVRARPKTNFHETPLH